jgi:LysR family nitrogen assimilation transcriptional regulator
MAMLRQAEDARASVKGLVNQPSGKVVFGLPPSICNVFALPLLQAVRKELPKVDFELTEELSGSLAAQLRAGELDLAVLLDDGELGAFRSSPLTSEQLLLISRPDAPSARHRKTISLKQALRMPLVLPRARQGVRPIIEAMAMRAGLPPPNVVSEINSVSILSTTVQAGIGMTIQAASAFKAELSTGLLVGVPITKPDLKRDLAICANKDVPLSTASQAVSAMATQVAQKLVHSGDWPFATCQKQSP